MGTSLLWCRPVGSICVSKILCQIPSATTLLDLSCAELADNSVSGFMLLVQDFIFIAQCSIFLFLFCLAIFLSTDFSGMRGGIFEHVCGPAANPAVIFELFLATFEKVAPDGFLVVFG